MNSAPEFLQHLLEIDLGAFFINLINPMVRSAQGPEFQWIPSSLSMESSGFGCKNNGRRIIPIELFAVIMTM